MRGFRTFPFPDAPSPPLPPLTVKLSKGRNIFISPPAGHERYLTEVVERSLLSLLLIPLIALIFLLVWKVSLDPLSRATLLASLWALPSRFPNGTTWLPEILWPLLQNPTQIADDGRLAPGVKKQTPVSLQTCRSDHGEPRMTSNRTPQTADSSRGLKGRRFPRIRTRRKSEYLFAFAF